MAEQRINHYDRINALASLAYQREKTIVHELLANLGTDNDKVRNAIGSVAFRALEELDAMNKQINAEFEEWIIQ